jgi:hypothetical protein
MSPDTEMQAPTQAQSRFDDVHLDNAIACLRRDLCSAKHDAERLASALADIRGDFEDLQELLEDRE